MKAQVSGVRTCTREKLILRKLVMILIAFDFNAYTYVQMKHDVCIIRVRNHAHTRRRTCIRRSDAQTHDDVTHEVNDTLEILLADAGRSVDGEDDIDSLVADCTGVRNTSQA